MCTEFVGNDKETLWLTTYPKLNPLRMSSAIMKSESKAPNNMLIPEPELMEKFACKRRADLARVLKNNNIRFFRGVSGAIVTTLDAINEPLIGTNSEKKAVIFE